ncbi:hypothetical protein QZH41_002309 [Actinostola sp. cb2023]|nr:hypothetical protein QZH41_002309 [Actinostola sp. cb2023]
MDEPTPKILDLTVKPIRSKRLPTAVLAPTNHVGMFELALQQGKSRENFINVLETFNRNNRPRRGHMDLLRVSMDFMDKFALEGDLEAYNALINVFPRGRFENRTLFDAIWPKKHPQVDLALEILTKMEENVVKPSLQTYDMCEDIFGKASQPVQKCRRLAYWLTKLEEMFPHPLPKTLPEDEVELSQLAITRMAKDTIPTILYQEGIKEKGINFIVGSQTMEQKSMLENYDIEIPVYVEGPYFMWVTTLDNGMKVVSLETHAPSSRVGLFIDAGSRYESQENRGVTHFVRSAAFSSTQDRTAFRIARELEQCGANLDQQIVDSLGSVTTNPVYSPWEIEEVSQRVKLDLAIAATQPQIAVLEDLHQVAYRKNLGNSIYCLPHRVNHITTNTLLDYSQQFFVGSGAALVGIGVDHQELVDQAKSAFSALPQGRVPTKEAAKYFGGEVINHRHFPMVHAAVVTEGASLGSNDMLAFGLLQRVLGTTPFIKWGSNTATSRLNKAASEVASGPFFASSLNMGYSDSGLFGLYVIATAADVGKVLIKGAYTPVSDVAAAVDSISKNDVLSKENQVDTHPPNKKKRKATRRERCCHLGRRMAKIGESCKYVTTLASIRPDNSHYHKLKTKVWVNAEKPVIRVKLLRKCKRFKAFYEKCCVYESRLIDQDLKRMIKRLKKYLRKIKMEWKNAAKKDKTTRSPTKKNGDV